MSATRERHEESLPDTPALTDLHLVLAPPPTTIQRYSVAIVWHCTNFGPDAATTHIQRTIEEMVQTVAYYAVARAGRRA